MVFLIVLIVCLLGPGAYAQETDPAEPASRLPDKLTDSALMNSRFLLFGSGNLRKQTLRWAGRGKRKEMAAALIYSLRYVHPGKRQEVLDALERITRKRYGDDWFRWMQWLQANPEYKPFAGFEIFLSGVFGSIDPGFRDFIYPRVKHTIRLEQIVWGGVASRDGIPALDHPQMTDVAAAGYLSDDELVFGVSINGDHRAYPYRFMDWHELLNDTVGERTVSLAYCTLCGSGILYETQLEDGRVFRFGSSGLLYQSNKLMYDEGTNSLWNQFTGQPVVGELAGSGVQLPTLPLVSTTWRQWKLQHPDTQVMHPETGFERDYRPGQPYGKYFKSPRLMFPTLTDDQQLKQKEQVFGLRLSGANQAWPLRSFRGGKVLNDQVGVIGVVLIGDAATREVRAYRRGSLEFKRLPDTLQQVTADGEHWQVTEAALVGPQGQQLTRLPGHLAFWFAWHNYLGGETLRNP